MTIKKNTLFAITLTIATISSTYAIKLETTSWNSLKFWQVDNFTHSWPAFKHSCTRLMKKEGWDYICDKSELINPNNPQEIVKFFETHFKPMKVYGDNTDTGLVTGYYEPIIQGSLSQTGEFKYPIYGKPTNMVRDGDKRFIINTNNTKPFYNRKQIDSGSLKSNDVILWTNNPIDLFFLHVQGSGKVRLIDGTIKHLQYSDNNGHNYVSIGGELIKTGVMTRDEINLSSLKKWMHENPVKAVELMHKNPRFIFFALADSSEPIKGSLNVPLTPERSVAVDPKSIPAGYPIWLETTLPDNSTYHRLMFAQDTGAAIKGEIRLDVFFGDGYNAEMLAGNMKQSGRIFLLQPK